jgi:hypothetical protein
LRQQEPYPALVMDRYWNLLQSNTSAQRLTNWLIHPDELQRRFCIDGKINLMRLMFILKDSSRLWGIGKKSPAI